MRSPTYMASTRSTRRATLLTLWSTRRMARPSSRNSQIRSENAAVSFEVSPANGSSISSTCGSRAIAFAISILRKSANGNVAGRRSSTALRPTRAAMARAFVSVSGSASSRVSLSGNSASLMFSSTVWRCSGRECWNTMPAPIRAIRCDGQPATSVPLMRTDPASGRSMPMMSFITVDLPEPFGPISPRIFPASMESDISLTATRPPNRLVRPLTSRCASAAMSVRFLAARQQAEEAARKKQHDKKRHGEHDEIRQVADRAERLAHGDKKDRAEHGTEYGAPPADHGGDDDLDADGDVDHRARRCRADVEDEQRSGKSGEEGADDERGELVLGHIETERAGLHRVLSARLQD